MTTETKPRLTRGQLEYEGMIQARDAFATLGAYRISIGLVLRETIRYAEGQLSTEAASDFFQKEVEPRLKKVCPEDPELRERLAALMVREFSQFFVNEKFAREE